jgi:hypothetical protein
VIPWSALRIRTHAASDGIRTRLFAGRRLDDLVDQLGQVGVDGLVELLPAQLCLDCVLE